MEVVKSRHLESAQRVLKIRLDEIKEEIVELEALSGWDEKQARRYAHLMGVQVGYKCGLREVEDALEFKFTI